MHHCRATLNQTKNFPVLGVNKKIGKQTEKQRGHFIVPGYDYQENQIA